MATDLKIITENLDLWTSALLIKSTAGRGSNGRVEAYGIKKLRALILELAVRGKLVSQDPDDEPASVLLQKIASEKSRLVKSGKIKKPNELQKIDDEDIPFFMPQGWEWERLGNLTTQITDGTHHTPTYIDQGVPFISVKDIDGNTVSFEDCKYISQKQHEDINSRCNPEFGDLLICRIGTLGRATIVDTHEPFSLFVSVGLIKFLQHLLIPKFVRLVLHSPLLTNQYDEIKAGGSHTNKLNLGDIPKLLIPVAPLAEQHRIVAKVDELLALCDQLEQQQTSSIEAHQTLVETLLGTLTNVESQQELTEAWNRIADHFDTLFTTEHSIDQLKQTILQLAVMGKLALQNPDDEPASLLLEKIAAERIQIFKEGKARQKDALPNIHEKERPYVLPNGWEWARLGQIIDISSGDGLTSANMDSSGEIPVYGGNGVTGYHSKANVAKPTLVIGRVGYYCGSIHITPALAWVTDNAFVTTFSEQNIYINYLYWLLKGTNLKENENATAQPVISGRKLYPIVIGLPPTREQHRIVAKIDELMALCDTLKARLAAAQTIQIHLADSIVEQAVA